MVNNNLEWTMHALQTQKETKRKNSPKNCT